MTGTASDAELMERVRSGDRTAFAVLVDRYKCPMVSYLSKMMGCRERAEEIAQEAFVRLYESAARYRESGRFAPYLYRIATNLARSEERRARRFRLLPHWFSRNGHGSLSSQEQALLAKEARAEVGRALAALPARFRAPLLLSEVEGLSYEEIAVVTGCREGTVKSRISRGKDRLREALAPYFDGGRR